MRKLISVVLSITIIGLTVISCVKEPLSAKAEEAEIVSFVNDSIELIRENDAGKDFIAVENNTEDFQLTTQSVNDDIKSNDTDFQTCRLIVKSEKPIDKLNSIGIARGFLNYYIVQFENEEDAKAAYTHYSSNCNYVETVFPDRVFYASSDYTINKRNEIVYSDETPEHLESWGSESTGIYELADFIESTHCIAELQQIKIAVIDSGVDLNHKFLKDRLIETKFNASDSGIENSEIDLVNGHGTMVSSVIADNTLDNAKIAVYRVLNDDGVATESAIIAAILKAVSDNADYINMSLGLAISNQQEKELMDAAVKTAFESNSVVVTGSGNYNLDIDYNNTIPASCELAVTAAASNIYNNPTSFSSRGNSVDIMAPGKDIPVAAPNDKYELTSGTSFSSPLTASLFVLLRTLYPSESNKQLEVRIESSADKSDLEGVVNMYGYGIIDAIGAAGLTRTETPVIVNEHEVYEGRAEIEISVPENSIVYYTMDQTYPSKENGTVYKEPIVIEDDFFIIRAVAYCDDDFRSDYTSELIKAATIGTDDMFEIGEDGIVTAYSGNVNYLKIPNTIKGIEVSGFANGLFSEAEIHGVCFSDGMTSITPELFSNNKTLQFADGEGITEIESKAFYNCQNLYHVNFPMVQTVGKESFYNTLQLSGINFKNCNFIGQSAFYGSLIRYVDLPSVETICPYAFERCNCIYEFYAPLLTEIRGRLFNGETWEADNRLFQDASIYCTLNFENLEYNPMCSFYQTQIKRIEFSNIKDIGSLPITYCKRPIYGKITVVLPSTLENCGYDSIPYYETKDDYKIKFMIYGSKGTYAEQWANENGFDFIEITPETAIITDLPEEYYSYMRPLEADVVGFNRTYQWYGSNTNSNTSGTAIDGAVERKFNPNEYKQYKYYYCIVTSTDVGYSPIEIHTGVTENKSYIAPEDLADYSGIKKLLETVPSDLSVYTEGSAERLSKLIDSINWNTEKSEQEQIDKLEKAIFEAINNLELKPADYSALDEALATIPINLSIYTDESVADLQAVVDGINRNLDITNQEQVDKYVIVVTNAIAVLKLKSADYAELEEVLKSVPSDLSIYTDESVAELQAVIDSIDRYLDITNQEQVNKKVLEIKNAVENLKLKPADYSAVYAAIAAVPSDLSVYTDETVAQLESVIESIDYTHDITNQKQVDEYAEQINEAVTNLKKECWLIRLFKMIVAFFKDLWEKLRRAFESIFAFVD